MNVPAEVLRCAEAVPVLSLGWDVMEAMLWEEHDRDARRA